MVGLQHLCLCQVPSPPQNDRRPSGYPSLSVLLSPCQHNFSSLLSESNSVLLISRHYVTPFRTPMHRVYSPASRTRQPPSPAGLSLVQIAISKFSAWFFRRKFWKRQLFRTSWWQWGAMAAGSGLLILTCNSTWQAFLFPRPFFKILCNFLPSASSWFPMQAMYLSLCICPTSHTNQGREGRKEPDCPWWSNEIIAIIINIFKPNSFC